MCRWHKHAVKLAATDPVTGEFHLGKYAVGLTAMALFRIEQTKWQMADLFEIDGFNPEELITDEAKAIFARSGLERPIEEVEASLEDNIERIRAALNIVADRCDLTKEGLSIPDIVTADGYKKTCCAPADPRENGPFLDAAVVNLFKGYDDVDRSYASGNLELITVDDLFDLENDNTVALHDRPYIAHLAGIRHATEALLNQPGLPEVLEDTFRDSVAFICQTAQDDFDNGFGLDGASNCIMCEGAKGRKLER